MNRNRKLHSKHVEEAGNPHTVTLRTTFAHKDSETHPKYRRSHIQGLCRDESIRDVNAAWLQFDSESPCLTRVTRFLSWLAAPNTT